MESKDLVTDSEITIAIECSGYTGHEIDECRLSLVELLSKAAAGYRNSHTEEAFMSFFLLLNKDRTINKRGRVFMCSMIYKHSNKKADIHGLIEAYRF